MEFAIWDIRQDTLVDIDGGQHLLHYEQTFHVAKHTGGGCTSVTFSSKAYISFGISAPVAMTKC